MITIPCVAPVKLFQFQLSLFQFQHQKVYGAEAKNKCLIPIVKQNHHNDPLINSIDWDIKLPYVMVDSIFTHIDEKAHVFCASNVFYAAKQLLPYLKDDDIVEIQDCDIFHLKPYTGPLPGDKEVIVNTFYENWHMHIATPESENSHVIRPYMNHQEEWYPNGGFNTIVKVSTLKEIIDDVIEFSVKVGRDNLNTPHAWWMQMYGLNIACHNNQIKMISMDNCYFPNMNQLDISNHHQAHYSCDPIFHKHQFPNLNVIDFPDNVFYNSIREWMYR
tara:strand:+ start:4276 stop:5100 length:825 start_codon:yes stop_codon:yes gene_type:complete